jgi:hypothetical protein
MKVNQRRVQMKTKTVTQKCETGNTAESKLRRLKVAMLEAEQTMDDAFSGAYVAASQQAGEYFPRHLDALVDIQYWIDQMNREDANCSLLRQMLNLTRAYEGYLNVRLSARMCKELS